MTRKNQSKEDKPLTPAEARHKLVQGARDYLAGNNPGPIAFRLKRSKKANATYPLKLTQPQRASLVQSTRLRRGLKSKIQAAAEGTQILDVTRKELDELNDEIGQAAYYAPSPDRKRLTAVQAKVTKFFEEEHAEVFGRTPPTTNKRPPTKPGLVFQFKITLLHMKPAIWRRIQITDCTLADLHDYIQAAFGWENDHLHQFEIEGERFSTPSPDDLDFGLDFKDETAAGLSKLLPKTAKPTRWIYEYDFGDGWQHEVLFEGYPPVDPKVKYPLCLEGQRACPPEDCGGPWGFVDFLAAVNDPTHEEHAEMLEWSGPFNPEFFDAKKATREMRKVK